MTVEADAAAVDRPVYLGAGGIVEPPQIQIGQGPLVGIGPLKVEAVGFARHQGYRDTNRGPLMISISPVTVPPIVTVAVVLVSAGTSFVMSATDRV